MLYLKNNNVIYPLNEELLIKVNKLNIGEKEIIGGEENFIKYCFSEIIKKVNEGSIIVNLNEIISSYNK